MSNLKLVFTFKIDKKCCNITIFIICTKYLSKLLTSIKNKSSIVDIRAL
jgi:hypothetical protein